MAMYAVVVKGGKFTFTVDKDLARGLRPSRKNPRNEEFLIECKGAVGKDGVLSSIEPISRLDTSFITDGFPFPQLFVLSHHTLVCGLRDIYELDGETFKLVYTATEPGGVWEVADYQGYIFMSNGREAVVRDHATGTWSKSATLPRAISICDYGGQVLVAAPDVDAPGISLVMPNSDINMSITLYGEYGG